MKIPVGKGDSFHCDKFNPSVPMQAPRPWLNQFVIAALGAGVVTSFAVAQGQNPFLALGITVFSGLAAVMLGQIL
jgi:hypothetical protein